MIIKNIFEVRDGGRWKGTYTTFADARQRVMQIISEDLFTLAPSADTLEIHEYAVSVDLESKRRLARYDRQKGWATGGTDE